MNHRILVIAALLALAPHPSLAAEGGCGDVPNCRRITPQEDAALRALLTSLEKALPVPDASRWERAATSDGMAERNARLAETARTFGRGRGPAQMFNECEPTWKGCFPRQTELTVGYQKKGSGEKTAKKARRGEPGSLESLMALAEAVADSMQYGLSFSIRLLPHPADNGCYEDEGYPRPVEKRKDFLHEVYDSDGEAIAALVFGERACKEPDEFPEVNAKTPMAPVRAVVVEVRGPSAEVKKLVAAIDQRPFADAVGPVVR